MSSDYEEKVKVAQQIVASRIMAGAVDSALLGPMFRGLGFPNLTDEDWQAVVEIVRSKVDAPTRDEAIAAYEFLSQRNTDQKEATT